MQTVDTRGLTAEEAAERLRNGLGNAAPADTSRSLWSILAANVFTLFNGIVMTGFGLLLVLGRWQDALFGFPALFNTLIGVVQEFKAKRTLDRLAVLNAPSARVLRDGVEVEVPLEEVVLDDVLVLRTGDQVTADARVLDARGLEIDESLLTGESDAIRKRPDDEVLSGSGVVAGSAHALVIRVGAESYAAQLTAEARSFSLVSSELRESQNRLLKWITWLLAPVMAILIHGQMMSVGGWGFALRTGAWQEAAVGTVAAVIAMIPLGLVLMTSIAFAAGGVKLAQKQVLIQELPAVEGLARVDVLCLDKTGTLTTGEIVFDESHPVAAAPEPGWERVLAWIGADVEANATARCLAEGFAAGTPLTPTGTVPFTSARKWSAVSFGAELPGTWVFGAPEMVLAPDAEAAERNAAVLARAGEFAAAGRRTLVLAHSPAAEAPEDERGAHLPAGLAPVALLTFRERVRPDAAQTLGYFAEQGVGVRVISGDDPRTVAAVAREVGLDVVEGYDARNLPEDIEELADVLDEHRVFGRVTPKQKKDMVIALKRHGHTVAMTGDGVNDALAIKEADIGIAMDTAAQATKAVSRLVLLDGRFDRMPGVVAEGRKAIANIERVSMLFLSKTTYAVALSLVFGIMLWGFPFLPRQLSITDGLTIGIPAFFLALMPNATRYRAGFLKRSLAFAIPAGLIVTAGLVAQQLISSSLGDFTPEELHSASTLTLAGIALWVLAVLARPANLLRILVVLAMYAGLALVWAIPLSRQFFEITWLPDELIAPTIAIVAVGIVLVEILRAWHLRFIAHQDEAVPA
ncbi:HAD-IC family P-type ATPase [Leucobacter sp. M11]|uniref:HAD-IC family P-type ATPase n=1 Tax=Leucobacter sp. M11 TaxID=2993565 RepID=UPI002D7E353E|nr:HAD-IC family P-type ATPase [Leucobacter sp. M11]MEB4615207.1 HAD-IC family P-type ATPase [Leucobacter sp. M11]